MRHLMLVALLVGTACGGISSDPKLAKLPAGTTVLDSRVGETGGLTTVRYGSFVAWRSADGLQHTITSSSTPAAFTEIDVPAGDVSEAVAITPAGVYNYYCAIHGAAVENGTVHVLVPGS
jgi:plastocyanin